MKISWAELLEEKKEEIFEMMVKCSKLDLQCFSALHICLAADGTVFYDEFVDTNSWAEYGQPVFHLLTFSSQDLDVLNECCDDDDEAEVLHDEYYEEFEELFEQWMEEAERLNKKI